jgi:hypothetical protein
MSNKILYYPVYHNPDEPGHERSERIKLWNNRFLIPAGLVTNNEDECTHYMVATGDSGMMRTAVAKKNTGKVIFGINCGRKGFLLEDINEISQIPVDADEIRVITLNLMKATFYCKNCEEATSIYVFNDIVLGKDVADYISFTIKGSLTHFIDRRVTGTGLVVSTPQGTTAYALKARGTSAYLPLDSKKWFIGGIATGPYPSDIVTPQEIVIEMSSRYTINGYGDGRSNVVENIRKVIIEPTDDIVRLGFLKTTDFDSRRRFLAQSVERGED